MVVRIGSNNERFVGKNLAAMGYIMPAIASTVDSLVLRAFDSRYQLE
jgi:hypothetical protein